MTVEGDEHESDRTITVRRPLGQAPVPVVGHFLTIPEGDQTRRVRIRSEGLVIGRQAPSTLVIPSPEISRRHCRIDIDGDWVIVTDLNSTNGTFVDENKIEQPTRLRNDARLSMGTFSIRYERRDPTAVEKEEELSADLRRAAGYVRAILPHPIDDGPVKAAWWFEPSSQLGGDAFGYQFLDDQSFSGFLLDVSGHGIGSALHAANVANVLRRRGLPDVDFRQPGQVIAALNTMFPMEEHNDLMLTLWYFVYDLPTRTLRYSAAGHHEAYLVSANARDAQALSIRGPTIDGAFEIVDAKGQEWPIETLRSIITSPVDGTLSEPDRIWRSIRDAARPGPLEDDVSVVVLTFD